MKTNAQGKSPPEFPQEKRCGYFVLIYRTLTGNSLHYEGKIEPHSIVATNEGWDKYIADAWTWEYARGFDEAKTQLGYYLQKGRFMDTGLGRPWEPRDPRKEESEA
jgi:hypothetical protein